MRDPHRRAFDIIHVNEFACEHARRNGQAASADSERAPRCGTYEIGAAHRVGPQCWGVASGDPRCGGESPIH